MTDGVVSLGGYVFQDFEIPEEISFGGKQQIKIHEMIGGQRFVDAMGPCPGDIRWKGRFRGPDAVLNAQSVDAMRIAGAAIPLMWLGIYYSVIIEEFDPRTEHFYEVPYTMRLVVVDDPKQDGGGLLSSLDSLVGGDLSAALSITSLV